MSDPNFKGHRFIELLMGGGHPTIKGHNRLEGRPRTQEFDRALRADVHDALWMLARQFQVGEFRGDDAGSPVRVRVQATSTTLSRYRAGDGTVGEYDPMIPLEARVERERPPLDLSLRLRIGRYFERQLARAVISRSYEEDFRRKYPVALPARDRSGAEVYAHRESWELRELAAGRALDGGALLLASERGEDILDGITVAVEDRAEIQHAERELRAWFTRTYGGPAHLSESAWDPSRLEYRFACAAKDATEPGEIALRGEEYAHGHLDWYAVDRDRNGTTLGARESDGPAPRTVVREMLPAPISFPGMPSRRWWELEDGKVDLGAIEANTTDLGRMLVVEMGLLYGNDWFLVPLELAIASLTRIEGIVVDDVFGEHTWIPLSHERMTQDFEMYRLTIAESDEASDELFLPPSIVARAESPPDEVVAFVRDEVANMVWAIETRIPLDDGNSRPGIEAARERLRYLRALAPTEGAPPHLDDAPLQYELMNTVPECFIPFIPVRVPGTVREIKLQRAAMLRHLPGLPPEKVRPRTAILNPAEGTRYFVEEREVPRAGVRVERSFQRARGIDGRVHVWLGRRKTAGHGEGSSGLASDRLLARAGGEPSREP